MCAAARLRPYDPLRPGERLWTWWPRGTCGAPLCVWRDLPGRGSRVESQTVTPRAWTLDPRLHVVVRRFPRDRHVVWMRFAQAGCRDLDHLGIAPECFERGDPAVAHAAPEPADHLEQHLPDRPLVGDASLD